MYNKILDNNFFFYITQQNKNVTQNGGSVQEMGVGV